MYKRTYTCLVEVEWDRRKAASNFKKHGIDFADAATVLSDDLAITVLDEGSEEERYVTLGMDALGRLLVPFQPVFPNMDGLDCTTVQSCARREGGRTSWNGTSRRLYVA
ncbi:MAG: BrnT family toxin [Acidiferrobacterales bacterium]